MYTSIYNPYVPQELFLAHHGILGQRWGKKNGPPYPLGAGDHSASEKKAGWRKSLAGGAAAVGRGTVKTAKAIGRGTVKTAKVVNKIAVRTHLKPRILMSEKEMTDSIARMRLSKQYKRALRGKFVNVEEAERNKGKGAISQLMSAIGNDVLVPTATGILRYAVAEKLGGKAEGEKVVSLKETIFNNKKGIGFRNNYFYDSEGNPVFRTKKGEENKNTDGGNKKEKGNKQKTQNLNQSPKSKEQAPPQPVTKNVEWQSSKEAAASKPTLTERIASLNRSVKDTPHVQRTRQKASSSNTTSKYEKIWKTVEPFKTSSHTSNSKVTKVIKAAMNTSMKDVGTYWTDASIDNVRDLGGNRVAYTLTQRISDLDRKIVKSRN